MEVAARSMAGIIADEHQKLNQHAAEKSDIRVISRNICLNKRKILALLLCLWYSISIYEKMGEYICR
ncbi:MAG: hypothetical protein K6E77_06560 [Lachnospiraceae bacterium]|nr:hypothetical protein [Lachnospiraceae bacterium]